MSLESELRLLQKEYERFDPKIAEEITVFIERVKNLISRIEEEVKQLRTSDLEQLYTNSFYRLLNTDFDQAHRFFIRNATTAINSSEEFNYPPFKEAFLKAISQRDILYIGLANSSYKNFRVTVNILMDQYCGNIEDYVNAVHMVRSSQGWGVTRGKSFKDKFGRTGNNLAAHIWAEKIYKVAREGGSVLKKRKLRKNKKITEETIDVTDKYKGKYEATIAMRIAAFGKLAPFWSLIEYGSAAYTEGNIEDAYPSSSPHPFVQRTISEISKTFSQEWKLFYNEQEQYIRDVADRYENEVVKLKAILEELIGLRHGPPDSVIKRIEMVLNNRLKQVYNDLTLTEQEDQRLKLKLEKFAIQISLGEIPATKRLYFTRVGGKRIEIRAKAELIALEETLRDIRSREAVSESNKQMLLNRVSVIESQYRKLAFSRSIRR